jgi:hypothetical protein
MSDCSPPSNTANESLEAWTLRVGGIVDFSEEQISCLIGMNVSTRELSEDEVITLALYFIITRRLFESKALSMRNKMFIKVLQKVIGDITTKLEITSDFREVWDST